METTPTAEIRRQEQSPPEKPVSDESLELFADLRHL